MAVGINPGSFCGCPQNKSPTVWGLCWGPCFLEIHVKGASMPNLYHNKAVQKEVRPSLTQHV